MTLPSNKMTGTVFVTAYSEIDRSAFIQVKEYREKQAYLTIPANGGMYVTLVVLPKPKTTVRIYPVMDAFIRQGIPTLNYGTDQSIVIGHSNMYGESYRSFLKFDLSSIGSDKTIVDAKLVVYKRNPTSVSQVINVYTPVTEWTEKNVTWANQPPISSLASYFVFENGIGKNETNVTAYVDGWHQNLFLNNGFELRAKTESLDQYIELGTREAPEVYRPYLEVTYYDTFVYTYAKSTHIANLTVRQSDSFWATALLTVRENPGESWKNAFLHVHTPDEIVPSEKTGYVVINRTEIPSLFTVRVDDKDLKAAFLTARVTAAPSDHWGYITVSQLEATGSIYVRYYDDKDANLSIPYNLEDTTSGEICVSIPEVAASLTVKMIGSSEIDAHITARRTVLNEYRSGVIHWSAPNTRNVTLKVRQKHEDLTVSHITIRKTVNKPQDNPDIEKSAKLTITKNYIPAEISICLFSFKDAIVSIRKTVSKPEDDPNIDRTCHLFVLGRDAKNASITVIGASMKNALLYVQSDYLDANVTVQRSDWIDYEAFLTVRQKNISEVISIIRVLGISDEDYAFIM